MIVLYHNQYKITEIVSSEVNVFSEHKYIANALLDLALQLDDEILVWCDESQRNNLNKEAIAPLFHHNKFLFSYASERNYFDRELGYIEDSPFVKVNKEVRYATWQMSSQAGAVHTSVLKACLSSIQPESNFDYFLNSLAKRAIVHGLFCYSEPALLQARTKEKQAPKSNLRELFKFTKQHYKTRWIFLLFFNLLWFEKRFPLISLLSSFFYAKRNFNPIPLNEISLASNRKLIEKGTIDVLIPTIGRKEYLFAVLKNLATQTYLPSNVIIIEQNPENNSVSDLDYIQNNEWPFKIKHQFTHQTGACNARNLGLALVESEFCFMADDDIVFENDLLEKAMQTFQTTGNEVFLVACHLKNQQVETQMPKQFTVFGAGHAFVKSSCLSSARFRMGYEFGFGEDNDFGMQLRLKGFDILYISTSKILHLKAPMGGFRTKPILRWQQDAIQPKPSPTVMLFRLLYDSNEQLLSYKTTLFLKNFNKSFFGNPFGYLKTFRQKWDASIFWAQKLKEE